MTDQQKIEALMRENAFLANHCRTLLARRARDMRRAFGMGRKCGRGDKRPERSDVWGQELQRLIDDGEALAAAQAIDALYNPLEKDAPALGGQEGETT